MVIPPDSWLASSQAAKGFSIADGHSRPAIRQGVGLLELVKRLVCGPGTTYHVMCNLTPQYFLTTATSRPSRRAGGLYFPGHE